MNCQQNNFTCQICLFQATIKRTENWLEISHELDYKKIQILPTGERSSADFTKTFQHKFKLWFYSLQLASQKPLQAVENIAELPNTDFNPIGKLMITVKEAVNLKKINDASLIFVRVRSHPFVCKTKLHVQSERPQWKQSFIVPINDSYGTIQFELMNQIHDGLLKKHLKEQVIGSAEIYIADILGLHSDRTIKGIELKIRPVEQEKNNCLLARIQGQEIEQKETDMKLMVSLRNMSSVYSLFASPPVNHYEGDKSEPDFNAFKMHLIRFKRIVALITKFKLSIEDMVDQKYPKFTFLIFSVKNNID